MGNSKVDRDREYMKKMWGTTKLASDYETFQPENDFLDNLANEQYQKVLREIENDDFDDNNVIKG